MFLILLLFVIIKASCELECDVSDEVFIAASERVKSHGVVLSREQFESYRKGICLFCLQNNKTSGPDFIIVIFIVQGILVIVTLIMLIFALTNVGKHLYKRFIKRNYQD
jgi:hypothetical protein